MLVVHKALSMYILHEDGWEEELGSCSLMRLHEGAERLRLGAPRSSACLAGLWIRL